MVKIHPSSAIAKHTEINSFSNNLKALDQLQDWSESLFVLLEWTIYENLSMHALPLLHLPFLVSRAIKQISFRHHIFLMLRSSSTSRNRPRAQGRYLSTFPCISMCFFFVSGRPFFCLPFCNF